jgi:peptidoglycan/xylan/chitin deacetylase (PgdA/CDA1 family)
MLRQAKLATLRFMQRTGMFDRIRDSRWRSERLLILCYHGIAVEDEHEWLPKLYMTPALLRQRFEAIRGGGYNVLPLGEALQKLAQKDLPPRSVVLTFDDGGYDFYKQASPALREFGFPATVYQTTYYSEYPRPIFGLAASYILWKGRHEVLHSPPRLGLPDSSPWDLSSEEGRSKIVTELEELWTRENLSGAQKDELLQTLASALHIDYDELLRKRLLQIMQPAEIREMAAAGFDIQLHTHRHITPLNEELFRREIADNRQRIVQTTGRTPTHFCYPSGHYETMFLPWLERENVVSATTCDPGLTSRKSHPLMLPRYVDTAVQPPYVFDAWLSGAGHLTSPRRPAEAARASERPASSAARVSVLRTSGR